MPSSPDEQAFRFGVGPAGLPGRCGSATAARWRDFVRRPEDLGYDAVNVGDHLDDRLAPLVALTAAGAATTRLKLGTFLLANDYRNPVVLAQEYTTLAALYPDRLEAGIGAGWLEADYRRAGIAFPRPGVRIDRLAEAVAIIKQLLASDASLPGAATRPPPMVLGGGGRRVLELSARKADIVAFNVTLGTGRMTARPGASASAEQAAKRVDWVRESAGHRAAELELQVCIHAVDVDPDPLIAARRVGDRLGLTAEEALQSPHVLVGPPGYIADVLQERRNMYGFSYISIGGGAAESLAPVVASLAGT